MSSQSTSVKPKREPWTMGGHWIRTPVKKAHPFYKDDETQHNGVPLTTIQVAYAFGVTTMTIYNWRRNRNLPSFHLDGGPKPPIRFDEGAILYWAEVHGVPIVHEDYATASFRKSD